MTNVFHTHKLSLSFFVIVVGLLFFSPRGIFAQDEAPMPSAFDDTLIVVKHDTSKTENTLIQKGYENLTAGEFTPARGFDLFKADIVSLNLSFYGLVRYINQLPGEQDYTDHLGNVRKVNPRNDIEWQRSFIWLTGFFYTPKFRYNVSVWSLGSTQQTLVFGQLMYSVGSYLTIGAGIGPNLGVRSLQGSWPFWLSSDRQMSEEFIRPGFTNTAYITGEMLPRFYYKAAVGNCLSQLGVKSSDLNRNLTFGTSFWWMPTTGEYGPRGGFGDLEEHQEVATRFGVSSTFARDGRLNPIDQISPLNTQVRLSDGVLLYETGALAPGVTVEECDYAMGAVDAGFKYKGLNVQVEYYYRSLSNFLVHGGTIPDSKIIDQALYVAVTYMVIPKYLDLHGGTNLIFDQYKRNPWEVTAGASYYPSGTRSWRMNLHINRVDKSPAGGVFGFYTAGQTGTTFSLGAEVLI